MNSVKTKLDNSVLTVTISRPESLNALNKALLHELETVIRDAKSNQAVRGIIITGEGEKAFVAGADIKEFTALTQASATELSKKGQALFKMIEDCEKPIIAAVNGFALGGGCELAMACHIRVATDNAKFGQPEVNLGIIPGYGGTQRLTQLVGRGKALELLMTGDLVSAQEAKIIGLVNHVVATHAELHTTVDMIMTKIISKGAIAISGIIKSVNAGFAFEDDGYQAEIANFSTCTGTEDFKEGAQAFIEKRKPNFKGH